MTLIVVVVLDASGKLPAKCGDSENGSTPWH